jgi:hypothetical protein
MTLLEKFPELAEISKLDRLQLRGLSAEFKMLVKCEAIDSVNEGLVNFYREKIGQATGEPVEFQTFKGWKDKGFKVRKGEKSFVVWGSPVKTKKKEEVKENNETEPDGKFYPLSYLFCSLQVEK